MKINRLKPEDRKHQEKITNLYEKWATTINDCYTMLNSENGDIKMFFTDGGLYDQPSVELFQLYAVQSAYKIFNRKTRRNEKKQQQEKIGCCFSLL